MAFSDLMKLSTLIIISATVRGTFYENLFANSGHLHPSMKEDICITSGTPDIRQEDAAGSAVYGILCLCTAALIYLWPMIKIQTGRGSRQNHRAKNSFV